ncbi:hypothetical protein AURDEDRAFT_111695 [Auricularia subglabra TFB-10046 SS5]|nr:hypothetical protein AURDEDRAFT_111695 [Auricularia subglabra TFB-10046 SS5]
MAGAETLAAPTAVDPSPHTGGKDRIGEELADDARIWRVYDDIAAKDDEKRITTWNRGLDNLALFAGLFSAVTTAFLIEAQQDMKPDFSMLTFLVLNASAHGQPFVQEPFIISSTSRIVNCLWVASLILSLGAALIAIMGKDWINMYSSRPLCNTRQWAEMRTYRLSCVNRWHMSGIIASAPVLLHISLLLFGVGLILFVGPDPLTQHLTLGLCAAVGALYFVTAVSAVIFADSPFRSPATQMLRTAIPTFFSIDPWGTLASHLKGWIWAHGLADGSGIPLETQGGSHADQPAAPDPELSPEAGLPTQQGPVLAPPQSIWAILRTTSIRVVSFVRSTPQLFGTAARVIRRWINNFYGRQLLGSSTWTAVRLDRDPKLVADSLSWLSGASPAPEIFSAILFAIGDMEFGGKVGPRISSQLRARVRAEMQHSQHKADFLTLSRFVLAQRNIPGRPIISYQQFKERFDMKNNPSLRREDGLAALILLSSTKRYPSASDVRAYCPQSVTQPRMMEFLLPSIPPQPNFLDNIVVLACCYWSHLEVDDTFDLGAELLRLMTPDPHESTYKDMQVSMQEEYANFTSKIKEIYGGVQAGPIELLACLSSGSPWFGDVWIGHLSGEEADRAAAELIMRSLEWVEPPGSHPCVASVFGYTDEARASKLFSAAWTDRRWSRVQLGCLLRALPLHKYHHNDSTFLSTPDHGSGDSEETADPPAVDRSVDYNQAQFEHAIARTVIMAMSPARNAMFQRREVVFGGETVDLADSRLGLSCLHMQLCHPDSLTLEDQPGIIKLILEESFLCCFLPRRQYWTPGEKYEHYQCCVDILAEIAIYLGFLLKDEDTFDEGAQLFGKFVRAEVVLVDHGLDPVIWDLGAFLRETVSRYHLFENHPHVKVSLPRLVGALKNIHSDSIRFHDIGTSWGFIRLPDDVNCWPDFDESSDIKAYISFFGPDRD